LLPKESINLPGISIIETEILVALQYQEATAADRADAKGIVRMND
jgi:hypothetical protein